MSYGQIAFEAYREHQSGLTYDGRPIPYWEELTAPVQGAWEAAAWAVIKQSQEGLSG